MRYLTLERVSYADQDEYAKKLKKRFAGDRFKIIVTIDSAAGPVKSAIMHLFDLHNPEMIRIDVEQPGNMVWLAPIYREILYARSDDGSPTAFSARNAALKYLATHIPDWNKSRDREDYICVDLAIMPASEMGRYLYSVLLT